MSPSQAARWSTMNPAFLQRRTLLAGFAALAASNRHLEVSTVGARKKECMNRQQQIEAAVVLFSAMLCLTGSFWKAILVSIFVLVSCVLGFGRRWLLWGSFAIATVAIAVVLGAPSPDQWVQLWQDAQRAFSVWLPGY